MHDSLGETLETFAETLTGLREALAAETAIAEAVFEGTAEWTDLLHYKLVPHFGGDGCLVVAFAGGTNTGKSTLFNLLVGEGTSPVRSTAAATCRPVLAANAARAAQALEGRLLPEFDPRPLETPESAVSRDEDAGALFVATSDSLPERLVLLDTPDVDSIDRGNWALADHVRAAGDVIIAVLTAEKYKDDRVIDFYREAGAAGRVILPLMNKANPADDFATARVQVADFCREVGLEDARCFVAPHDFDLATRYDTDIAALDGGPPLREYLASLPVAEIKARVFRDTVRHFAQEAEGFLEHAEETADGLRHVASDFADRVRATAEAYDPEPGERVGKLLHDHIKSRRGAFSRGFGQVAGLVGKGLAPVRRIVAGAIRRPEDEGQDRRSLTETEIRERHLRAVATGARNLARGFTESAPALRPPANLLVQRALNGLDTEKAVARVVEETVHRDNISDAFRAHVANTLDAWWRDNALKRWVLMELDALLIVTPTAVCVPLSFYTAGVGVAEVTAVAGILGGGLFEQILLHQFSDHWLDLVGPWRAEQQAAFAAALETHLAEPGLEHLRAALAPFEAGYLETMRECRQACLNHLQN